MIKLIIIMTTIQSFDFSMHTSGISIETNTTIVILQLRRGYFDFHLMLFYSSDLVMVNSDATSP